MTVKLDFRKLRKRINTLTSMSNQQSHFPKPFCDGDIIPDISFLSQRWQTRNPEVAAAFAYGLEASPGLL
jgi:hypothetical protein